MAPRSNATHLWGECPRCGKIEGLTSREAIRRYMRAEETRKEANAKIKRITDEIRAARRGVL
jgi:phage FluMu protein Com